MKKITAKGHVEGNKYKVTRKGNIIKVAVQCDLDDLAAYSNAVKEAILKARDMIDHSHMLVLINSITDGLEDFWIYMILKHKELDFIDAYLPVNASKLYKQV